MAIFAHQIMYTLADQLISMRKSLHRTGFSAAEADRYADIYIKERLYKHSPSIPILSEETYNQLPMEHWLSTHDEFWLIDPLDGTWAFDLNVPGWGHMIHLFRSGAPYASYIRVHGFGSATLDRHSAVTDSLKDQNPKSMVTTVLHPACTETAYSYAQQLHTLGYTDGLLAVPSTSAAVYSLLRGSFSAYYNLAGGGPWDFTPLALLPKSEYTVVGPDLQPWSLLSGSSFIAYNKSWKHFPEIIQFPVLGETNAPLVSGTSLYR